MTTPTPLPTTHINENYYCKRLLPLLQHLFEAQVSDREKKNPQTTSNKITWWCKDRHKFILLFHLIQFFLFHLIYLVIFPLVLFVCFSSAFQFFCMVFTLYVFPLVLFSLHFLFLILFLFILVCFFSSTS